MINPITQAIDRLATTQERRWSHLTTHSGRMRSAHRATDASHEALLHGLRHSVGIAFRSGPAVAWVLERHELAKQLNLEALREREGGNALPVNNAPSK